MLFILFTGDIQVRLKGGSSHNEGYVEIKVNNQDWKGVCDDYFDINDAHVICRMAGYPFGASAYFMESSPFGYGSSGDHFAVNELECTGNETSIADCPRNEWNDEDCSRYEWAGVQCKKGKTF